MSKSMLQKAFDMLDDYEKNEENKSVLMVAVEFDKNGFPSSRAVKCVGAPSSVLASITLLRDMIDDMEQQTLEKIDKMGEASDNITDILKEMGIDDMNDPRIEKLFKDPQASEELMKLMKDIKRKFGK